MPAVGREGVNPRDGGPGTGYSLAAAAGPSAGHDKPWRAGLAGPGEPRGHGLLPDAAVAAGSDRSPSHPGGGHAGADGGDAGREAENGVDAASSGHERARYPPSA